MQNSNIYYTTEKYANLTDEQIISQIKEGDEQALTFLLDKYKDLVNMKEVEVTKIRNLGKKSLKEVIDKVKEMGLNFKD